MMRAFDLQIYVNWSTEDLQCKYCPCLKIPFSQQVSMQEMTISCDGETWTIFTSTTLKNMTKVFKVTLAFFILHAWSIARSASLVNWHIWNSWNTRAKCEIVGIVDKYLKGHLWHIWFLAFLEYLTTRHIPQCHIVIF